jgi:hypothetical protein
MRVIDIVKKYFDKIGYRHSSSELMRATTCVIKIHDEFKDFSIWEITQMLYPEEEFGGNYGE